MIPLMSLDQAHVQRFAVTHYMRALVQFEQTVSGLAAEMLYR